MKSCVIGIDNGVSGSICIIHNYGKVFYTPTPSFNQLSYQKEAKFFTRVDTERLEKWFIENIKDSDVIRCLIERPFVNPKMFNSTLSAIRAYEATIIILERLKIPYENIDSKEWQIALLPHGILGVKSKDKKERKENKKKLKQAADNIAKRLFPGFKFLESGGDGFLIAEHARRNYMVFQ